MQTFAEGNWVAQNVFKVDIFSHMNFPLFSAAAEAVWLTD